MSKLENTPTIYNTSNIPDPDMNSNIPNLSETRPITKILTLPLELRQEIYSYLCPPHHICNPIPNVGLTSLSHHPPPLSLLLSCSSICLEVTAYFHSISTWKLIASHAFNFYRIDPCFTNLCSSPILAHLSRVELVFVFDGCLLASYPSLKTIAYCKEITKRASRACEILCSARNLRTVVVSWVDTTADEGMEEKKECLDALRCLKGRSVKLEVGSLEWSGAKEERHREEFETKVKGYIRDLYNDWS
ncbi:hypothetical protein E4T52_10102 [Aureobasidium sp. EXF-3400]|nr:hypothetical protein E4T52_10102 [Aureobasidium sp. EXF-3400]